MIGGARLAVESLQGFAVMRDFLRQEFDRDLTIQVSVLRLTDNTIPPPPSFSRMR